MNLTEDDSLELIKSGLDDAHEKSNRSKASLGGWKTGVDATLEKENTVTLVTENDEPTIKFFIGDIDPSSDAVVPAKRQKLTCDSNWGERLLGDHLDHANSYEATLLVKEVTEEDDYLYEELIENCPDDVKMEVIDDSPNYAVVVINTEEATVKSEIKSKTQSVVLLNESGWPLAI